MVLKHINNASPMMLGWERLFLFAFAFILLLSLSSALSITQTSGPTNNTLTDDKDIELNYNISGISLPINNLTININNSKFDLFNQLTLYYNFNNYSSLSESEINIADLSKYSSNGTIRNWNNTKITPNGRYLGAVNFSKNGTTIPASFITINSTYDYPLWGLNNHTIAAWVYITDLASTKAVLTQTFGANADRYFMVDGANLLYSDSSNITNFKRRQCNSPTFVTNRWYHIAVSFEFNNSFKFFIDGVECSAYSSINPIQWELYDDVFNSTITNQRIGASSSGSYMFNGTIDEVMMWNRSLSQAEVLDVYKTNLNKLSNNNFLLFINMSNLSTQKLYSNSIYINDSTAEAFIQSNFYLNFLKAINVSYNTVNGIINKYFYGINMQDTSKILNYTIDTDCDGTRDTTISKETNKQIFLDSKLGYARLDGNLGAFYVGLSNLNMEYWNNLSYRTITTYTSGIAGTSWDCSSSGGIGKCGIGYDKYNGQYSFNVTSSNSTQGVFFWKTISADYLKDGMYNLSMWAKGNLTLKLTNATTPAYTVLCSTNNILLSNWTLISCSYNKTGRFGDEIAIEVYVNGNNTALIDDVAFTYNNNQSKVWYSYNYESGFPETFKLLKENDKKSLLIVSYMPTFLADKTHPGCNVSKLTDCPPYNYTIYEEVITDYLANITVNGLYDNQIEIEVWNEPYGGSWLSNFTYDSLNKSIEYIKLYNSTYNAVKRYNSNIPVYGPSGFRNAPNMTLTFLSNMTTKMDGVTIHPYGYTRANQLEQYNDTKNLLALCSTYGANCSQIVLSEWTIGTSYLQNGTYGWNEYAKSYAESYESLLNNYPTIKSLGFHWTDPVSYFNCQSRYSEYPSHWSWISNAGLDNPTTTYYPPYNVTKDFATYCPAGGQVVSSTSDYGPLKVVSCISTRTGHSLIIINSDIDSINVTLDTDSIAAPGKTMYVLDRQTGAYSYASGELIDLGVIPSYSYKIFSYAEYDTPVVEACQGIMEGLGKFGDFVPIIITVIIAGIVILMIKQDDVDLETGGLMILLTLMVVSVGGIIITKIAGTC